MKLPPPTVTGSAIPSDLKIKNSQLEKYNELQAIRQQAQQDIQAANKKYAFKDKYSTPVGIKILGCTITLAGLLLLAKKLFKK